MTILIFFLLFTLVHPSSAAQNTSPDAILFVWNDEIYAQSLADNHTIATKRPYSDHASLPPSRGNIFDYAASPLTAPPINDYGFHQGVWSPDKTTFAFLAIQPNDAGYHVILAENEVQQILFSGEITPERGYLVPVGWSDDGALFLLERHTLHHLNKLRLWTYTQADSPLSLQEDFTIPNLKGNNATLSDGKLFIGFDTVGQLGYLFNLNTRQLTTFLTTFALQDPPPSVFEVYPVAVVAVVNTADLQTWLSHPAPPETQAAVAQQPWLYWPLPDHARSITCYPDSEWTDLNFSVECPGLTTPRAYQGHEGTDIGGKPNGLALSTPIFAAARGIVIGQNTNCLSDDITCGDAYGNTVLLEHTLIINHDVQTWFTGYAHLQTVLVDTHAYIRDIGLPIALSGDTGLGGAHLHIEIRSPQHPSRTHWIDPWDTRLSLDNQSLWVSQNEQPLSAVIAAPPPTLMTCQTIDGNNIRTGPGTNYSVVTKSSATETYQVFQSQRVETGGTPGDWYHIRWSEPQLTGWIWADLMPTCTATTPQ
jgi:murein DD-endopeptidase MepM/ murein hydrolase activator NlpD